MDERLKRETEEEIYSFEYAIAHDPEEIELERRAREYAQRKRECEEEQRLTRQAKFSGCKDMKEGKNA